MLTLQPIDDPDADPVRLHATRFGDSKWEIIKREQERHEWRITTPYDDPQELRDKSEITAGHSDSGETRTIRTAEIAPADAEDGDWEFRWGTSDRRVKRYLYIGEALLRADVIACTQEFPPARFDELVDAYEALPADSRLMDCSLE